MKIDKCISAYLFHLMIRRPMLIFFVICVFNFQFLQSQSFPDPGKLDSTWWNRMPLRIIQTNLRETDALMDQDSYMRTIEDASANVVILNVGGIVANYPTQLPFHHKNIFMKGNLVRDLVTKLHAKGIKVIGRFDVSKINEELALKKPEWLYVGTNGKNVNYNGQVHTCVNGGYQQDYGFQILKEAIAVCNLDGIFFNMPGYTTSDYSGNYHGICKCENCKKRYHDSTGLNLPLKEDMNDPLFVKYNTFRKTTSEHLFQRIGNFIKEQDPKLVVCTYTDVGVDLIRSESSSWLTSEYEWNYFSTDHVKRVLGSYKDRAPSNLLQYFLAIGYRHIATSPNILRVWLLQNMLNAAPLDVYVIGTLANQYDREFIPIMNEIYAFHLKNEKIFTNVKSRSQVALVRGTTEEYRGLIKLLTESHIMFDVVEASVIGTERMPKKLQEYDVVITGDVANLDERVISFLDTYVNQGGHLLSTGFTSTRDGQGNQMNRMRMKSIGVEEKYDMFKQAKSTYLVISDKDKEALGNSAFASHDLMMMYSDFLKCKVKPDAKSYLKLLPQTMFGPPEKSYYLDADITNYPGVVYYEYGKGRTVYLPWMLGSQYNFKGNIAHKKLFVSVLENLLQLKPALLSNASPLVEISQECNENGGFEWIGLINHSGQIGASFQEPVAIHDIKIKFKPVRPLKSMSLLHAGVKINFIEKNGWVECEVPKLSDYDILYSEYKK